MELLREHRCQTDITEEAVLEAEEAGVAEVAEEGVATEMTTIVMNKMMINKIAIKMSYEVKC